MTKARIGAGTVSRPGPSTPRDAADVDGQVGRDKVDKGLRGRIEARKAHHRRRQPSVGGVALTEGAV